MKLTSNMLLNIGEQFPLSVADPAHVRQLKVNGMTFSIRAFRVKGFGWVSEMTATGFLGLMKMDTLIINPTDLDLPLLSYDRVLAMGNDTLIFELYDTQLNACDLHKLDAVQEEARHLPDHDLGAHWYDSIKLPQSFSKKGKKVHTAAFDKVASDYLKAYLAAAKSAVPCEALPKREKASVYVEGLLEHGGPSTDVFKKELGEEKTAALFRTVLFGTQE